MRKHLVIENLGYGVAVAGWLACAAWLLTACTPQQQATASAYQQQIAVVCNTAMSLAPLAGPYGVYIVAGCGTEEAIAKLALDSNSLNWVNGLVAGVQALRTGKS